MRSHRNLYLYWPGNSSIDDSSITFGPSKQFASFQKYSPLLFKPTNLLFQCWQSPLNTFSEVVLSFYSKISCLRWAGLSCFLPRLQTVSSCRPWYRIWLHTPSWWSWDSSKWGTPTRQWCIAGVRAWGREWEDYGGRVGSDLSTEVSWPTEACTYSWVPWWCRRICVRGTSSSDLLYKEIYLKITGSE